MATKHAQSPSTARRLSAAIAVSPLDSCCEPVACTLTSRITPKILQHFPGGSNRYGGLPRLAEVVGFGSERDLDPLDSASQGSGGERVLR
jgi:hypothetical protein